MAASRRSPIEPWSSAEEMRLLLWAMAKKSLADFARAGGRSPGSVRLKLMRLRADPLTRPPEFTQQDLPNAAAVSACAASTGAPLPTDAAAPRVEAACGPADTPDGT